MFGFAFAPRGWMQCNGQTLPISQYAALFSLIGTYYGGNGTSNFQLPNMQSRAPVHVGNGGGSNFVLGQAGGQENHTLLYNEMPMHTHTISASTTVSDALSPVNAFFGGGAHSVYKAAGNPVPLAPQAVGSAGGNAPHPNLPPFQTVNFCICTQGIFPSRN